MIRSKSSNPINPNSGFVDVGPSKKCANFSRFNPDSGIQNLNLLVEPPDLIASGSGKGDVHALLPGNDSGLSPGVRHVPVLALGLDPLNSALGVQEQGVGAEGIAGNHNLERVDLKVTPLSMKL